MIDKTEIYHAAVALAAAELNAKYAPGTTEPIQIHHLGWSLNWADFVDAAMTGAERVEKCGENRKRLCAGGQVLKRCDADETSTVEEKLVGLRVCADNKNNG